MCRLVVPAGGIVQQGATAVADTQDSRPSRYIQPAITGYGTLWLGRHLHAHTAMRTMRSILVQHAYGKHV